MITKDQIIASFEINLLEGVVKQYEDANQVISLEIVTKLWFDYLKICLQSKEINQHQYSTWILPEKYKERY